MKTENYTLVIPEDYFQSSDRTPYPVFYIDKRYRYIEKKLKRNDYKGT